MTNNKHELELLLSNALNITVYRGCIVSKIIGGYSVFGIKCKNVDEVETLIQESKDNIQKSIIN